MQDKGAKATHLPISQHNFFVNKLFIVFSFVFLFVGLGIGFFVSKNRYQSTCAPSDFKYINQQLECNPKFVVDKRSYAQLKTELEKTISEKIEAEEITSASIYFRDLQYGPTLGIKEHELFSPASLLKLPVMLTYLNLKESSPTLLETKVYYQSPSDEDLTLTQSIIPKKSIQQNTPYSIEELIEYMIKYSDNKSYYVLLEYLSQISPDRQLLRETFVDLGIIDPRNEFEDTLTVKSYAGIFTQLFNSSYFSKKETSEEALNLLSNTDFVAGLVAGVPKNMVVAHKFGERFDSVTGLKQLHDCGIVYYPQNPYLVCVMTKGNDMDKLATFISQMSKMFYDEFDSRKL